MQPPQQQTRLGLKLLTVGGLILLLLIPQGWLGQLIQERAGWRSQAYDSIAQSWPGRQTFAGPIMRIPYTLTYDVKETIKEKDGTERIITKTVQQKYTFDLIPKQLNISSKLASSIRYRGIYAVPVYDNELQVSGSFDTAPLLEMIASHQDKKLTLDAPELAVLVKDQRGIAAPPRLKWNKRTLDFRPSSEMPGARAGMHARLNALRSDQRQQFDFSFAINLRGMSAMNFALLAENSQVKLYADWPHPKFTGELLPETHDINSEGFSAEWRASAFSYNVSDALQDCQANQCQRLLSRAVGFDLLQPVDVYQQSERSIKYGALFIILTFAVMLLFEAIRAVPLHPVQYLLVGMGLTIFYLLLISLSEHIRFIWAYSLAALAIATLLASYFGAILRSRRLGLALGGGLLLLYGLLFWLLQAEDKALLMGSLLVFGVFAAIMISTRHVDWYALSGNFSLPKFKSRSTQTRSPEPPDTTS